MDPAKSLTYALRPEVSSFWAWSGFCLGVVYLELYRAVVRKGTSKSCSLHKEQANERII